MQAMATSATNMMISEHKMIQSITGALGFMEAT
jgi:hypothetical protein